MSEPLKGHNGPMHYRLEEDRELLQILDLYCDSIGPLLLGLVQYGARPGNVAMVLTDTANAPDLVRALVHPKVAQNALDQLDPNPASPFNLSVPLHALMDFLHEDCPACVAELLGVPIGRVHVYLRLGTRERVIATGSMAWPSGGAA